MAKQKGFNVRFIRIGLISKLEINICALKNTKTIQSSNILNAGTQVYSIQFNLKLHGFHFIQTNLRKKIKSNTLYFKQF